MFGNDLDERLMGDTYSLTTGDGYLSLELNYGSLPDYYNETGGDDVIYGYGGVDAIFGQKGDDVLDGGLGDDLIVGGKGDDKMFGGDGADYLYGDEKTSDSHD